MRYFRISYLITSIPAVEKLILQIAASLVSKFSYLRIPKKQWNIYPRIVIYLFIFLNIFTNAFILFRYKISGGGSFRNKSEKDQKETGDGIDKKYVTMLYFVVTTITGAGYGDVIPLNFSEYFVTMILLLFGVFIYGFVITKIKIIVRRSFSMESIRNEELEDYDSFLIGIENRKRKNLIVEVEERFGNVKFVPVLWNCKMTNLLTMKNDAIKTFSSTFFTQLEYSVKQEIFEMFVEMLQVKLSGIFKLFSEILNFHFFELMEIKVWFKDQYILKKGEKSDGFYLILSGTVQMIYNEKSLSPIFQLSEGGIFGESCLLGESEVMSSLVTSKELILIHISEECLSSFLSSNHESSSSKIKSFCLFKHIIYKVEFDRFNSLVDGVLMHISKRHTNFIDWKSKSRKAIERLLDDLYYDCLDYLSYDYDHDHATLMRVFHEVKVEILEYIEDAERVVLCSRTSQKDPIDYEDIASEKVEGLHVRMFEHQNIIEPEMEVILDFRNAEMTEPRPNLPKIFVSKPKSTLLKKSLNKEVPELSSLEEDGYEERALRMNPERSKSGMGSNYLGFESFCISHEDKRLSEQMFSYIMRFTEGSKGDNLFRREVIKYLSSKNIQKESVHDSDFVEDETKVIDRIKDEESVESEEYEDVPYYDDECMDLYNYGSIEHEIKVLEGRLNNIKMNYRISLKKMLIGLSDASTMIKKLTPNSAVKNEI